jgi:peptidoglycan/LPS O-acetylase OafA/YrhL
MNKLNTKAITSVKYIYLVVFFVLLAGFFHPFITETSFDNVIVGTLILLIGLAGGVLVYKASISESKRGIFFGGGFGLIAISLYFVFQMTGRI